MMQVILISEVVMSSMFIFRSERARNIRAAYPGVLCMPAPMMLTLARLEEKVSPLAPIDSATGWSNSTARSSSFRLTVKVRSVTPWVLTFWTMVSTLRYA